MTNINYSLQRDAGSRAKRILTRVNKRRRAKELVETGRRTRAWIRIFIAFKIALITTTFMLG
ncbi:hypothetical protein ACFQUU_27655 [Herbaspirillum sp. GCM10030257]|uniref:hypothetical protein n=1 Tax=Herbaspirillum sp. GCM10030257 TaxID=3273393 RepID=UPI00361475A6